MKGILLLLPAIFFSPLTIFAQYSLQFGGAVAVNNQQIIVGEGRQLLLPGEVFIFDMDEDSTWNLDQVLNLDRETATGFGQSLVSQDRTLAIGAPLSGEVHIYSLSDDGQWLLSEVLVHPHALFGTSLSLNEDYLFIGATGHEFSKGGAYLYVRQENGSWEMKDELIHDVSASDQFGQAVLIHGSNLVVGAPRLDQGTGSVFVYSYGESSELLMQEIRMQEGETGDLFGASLTSVGADLVIGAPGRRGGTVSIFSKDERGTWNRIDSIESPDPEPGNRFGAVVAGSHDHLWISAPGYNERTGGLFFLDLSSKQLSNVIHPDALQFRSEFGSSLSTDGQVVAIGATGHDNYEGAVFPLHATGDQFNVGPALFNIASEIESVTGAITECERGTAGMFPCAEVDMVSFLTRQEIGARRGIQVNDVWGWEDPETGREYALVGRTDGTSFIDLTDPYHPVYLGDLPKTSSANQSLWRDIKVYKDHAFIVADGAGAHHMQIFDLSQLRGITQPQMFQETALYKGIYSSHNIAINEESGYAYAVGSDSGGETCGGALHMINIQDPLNPFFAGCFTDTRTGRGGSGATHDAQCVTYNGPDRQYHGREICLSSNVNALSIADVTDKDAPIPLSIAHYPNVSYTHQGWLTEDQRYFFLNDEGDEMSELVEATRTLIFDISDLEDPILAKEYFGPSSAIDHNLYIQETIMYQTNYVEGLRIIDVSDPENPVEIGHFDTVPYGPNDNSPVLGAWSNYPFFKSGTIVVTSGREGVFFLKRRSVDM